MRNITVRDATESDVPALVGLLAQLDPGNPEREDRSEPLPYAYHLAFRHLAQAGGRVLVIEKGRRLIGTLTVYIVPNVTHRGAPFAIIENVVVDEAQRSKGYGRLLMERAAELARDHGCYKISLTSNKRRKEAHRFYSSLGYERTHEAFRLNL